MKDFKLPCGVLDVIGKFSQLSYDQKGYARIALQQSGTMSLMRPAAGGESVPLREGKISCNTSALRINGLFYLDQLIFQVADADFRSVLHATFPVGGWGDRMEVILVGLGFSQTGMLNGRLRVDCVCTSHIQGHRVEGGEESHIRHSKDSRR